MNFSTLLECEYCECKQPFQPTNKRQRFCSANCRAAASYLPIKLFNTEVRNAKFAALNRDRAIGFDGRHSGSENSSSLGSRIFPRLCLKNSVHRPLVATTEQGAV